MTARATGNTSADCPCLTMSCFYGRDSRTRAQKPILHSTTGRTQAHLLRRCGPFPCQQQPRPCHPTHSRHGLAYAFTTVGATAHAGNVPSLACRVPELCLQVHQANAAPGRPLCRRRAIFRRPRRAASQDALVNRTASCSMPSDVCSRKPKGGAVASAVLGWWRGGSYDKTQPFVFMTCFYGRNSRTRAQKPILHSTTGRTQAHLLRRCGPFPCQQQPRPCHPTHSRHGLAYAFTTVGATAHAGNVPSLACRVPELCLQVHQANAAPGRPLCRRRAIFRRPRRAASQDALVNRTASCSMPSDVCSRKPKGGAVARAILGWWRGGSYDKTQPFVFMSCFYGRDSRTRAQKPILHSTTGRTQAHLLRRCGPFPCQQQPRPCHPTHSRHGLAYAFTIVYPHSYITVS